MAHVLLGHQDSAERSFVPLTPLEPTTPQRLQVDTHTPKRGSEGQNLWRRGRRTATMSKSHREIGDSFLHRVDLVGDLHPAHRVWISAAPKDLIGSGHILVCLCDKDPKQS